MVPAQPPSDGRGENPDLVALLATIVDDSPMAIVQYRGGRVSYISPNIERLWGYAVQEVAGQANFWHECLHPDDQPRFRSLTEQVHRERQTKYRFEYRLRCGDGQFRWFESAVTVVYADDGSTSEFTAFVFDISESKRYQEQQRLKAQVGTILSSSLVLDDLLRQFTELLSSELGDICCVALCQPDQEGQEPSPAYVPQALSDRGRFVDDRRRWLQYRLPFDQSPAVRTRIRAGEPVYLRWDDPAPYAGDVEEPDQFRRHGRPPRARWLLIHPLRVDRGTIGVLVLVSRQENPRSVEELIECAESIAWRLALAIENTRLYAAADAAKRRLDTLIEHLPSPVIVTDDKGTPIRMNEAARSWSRDSQSVSEPAPVPFEVCDISGRPLPWAERPIYRTLFGGHGGVSNELMIRDRSGALRPVLVTTAPIHTDDGRAIGSVAVFHDLSSVKALETERHHAVETQARLEGVQLAAHEMSHRIINDITSAYGAFAMVADGIRLPDDARELVDNGLEGLALAIRHIRQFSQAAKIQTRRTPDGFVLDLPPAIDPAA